MGFDSKNSQPVYIMRVASKLTQMHPQTLRKYEKAGLLEPSRNNRIRMYSREDIDRLMIIKKLVEERGLNVAGVKIVLDFKDMLMEVQKYLDDNIPASESKIHLIKGLNEIIGKVNLIENATQVYLQQGGG
jgi:MerR family transcriptional regulator/heat shock protein HspR